MCRYHIEHHGIHREIGLNWIGSDQKSRTSEMWRQQHERAATTTTTTTTLSMAIAVATANVQTADRTNVWMNEMRWRVWIKNNKQYDWKSCYDMPMLARTHAAFSVIFALIHTRAEILQSDRHAYVPGRKNDTGMHMNCIAFGLLGEHFSRLMKSSQALFSERICQILQVD